MVENKKDLMEYRYLGSTGIRVSVFSYGSMLMRDTPEDFEKQKQQIQKMLDYGVNYFDTAEVYSDGEAETLMGKAFKELGTQRKDIVVSTKLIRESFVKPCS